jgi:flagellar FliL protein
MAEGPSIAAQPAKKPKKSRGVPLIGAVLITALGVGGWLWYRSGQTHPQQESDNSSSEVKSVMHLESFVVNLSGTSENGYLRVGIDLGIGIDLKEGEKTTAYTGRLRDTILTVLGTRTVDELLTADGKAKLKQDILKAINDRLPELQCKEVYFTDFLVQH